MRQFSYRASFGQLCSLTGLYVDIASSFDEKCNILNLRNGYRRLSPRRGICACPDCCSNLDSSPPPFSRFSAPTAELAHIIPPSLFTLATPPLKAPSEPPSTLTQREQRRQSETGKTLKDRRGRECESPSESNFSSRGQACYGCHHQRVFTLRALSPVRAHSHNRPNNSGKAGWRQKVFCFILFGFRRKFFPILLFLGFG